MLNVFPLRLPFQLLPANGMDLIANVNELSTGILCLNLIVRHE